MPPTFTRPIAADAYEALIEDRILCAGDLYHLDGEIAFRRRAGRIETFDSDLIDTGGRL